MSRRGILSTRPMSQLSRHGDDHPRSVRAWSKRASAGSGHRAQSDAGLRGCSRAGATGRGDMFVDSIYRDPQSKPLSPLVGGWFWGWCRMVFFVCRRATSTAATLRAVMHRPRRGAATRARGGGRLTGDGSGDTGTGAGGWSAAKAHRSGRAVNPPAGRSPILG